MSKVKLDWHFMMLYASLKESQRINYTTFATSCKVRFESFSFFLRIAQIVKPPDSRPLIHRHQRKTRPDKAQSFLIACPLLGIVIRIQLSKVNSLTGKCCSCFTQRFNYTISSFPTQGGFWNFLVGLTGIEPATPALPYHIAFASWSGLCYNHSINGLGSASIVSTHL